MINKTNPRPSTENKFGIRGRTKGSSWCRGGCCRRRCGDFFKYKEGNFPRRNKHVGEKVWIFGEVFGLLCIFWLGVVMAGYLTKQEWMTISSYVAKTTPSAVDWVILVSLGIASKTCYWIAHPTRIQHLPPKHDEDSFHEKLTAAWDGFNVDTFYWFVRLSCSMEVALFMLLILAVPSSADKTGHDGISGMIVAGWLIGVGAAILQRYRDTNYYPASQDDGKKYNRPRPAVSGLEPTGTDEEKQDKESDPDDKLPANTTEEEEFGPYQGIKRESRRWRYFLITLEFINFLLFGMFGLFFVLLNKDDPVAHPWFEYTIVFCGILDGVFRVLD